MTKVNVIGISGAALSLVCVVMIWVVAIVLTGISGNMTDLEMDLRALMVSLAVVYTFGAVVGLVSQLGAFLQLPSIVIGIAVVWYLHGSPILYFAFLAAFLAAGLLIISMFVDYSGRERKGFTAPPPSRIWIWKLGDAGEGAKPITRRSAVAIAATLCACLITVAAFTAYVRTSDVSNLTIEFITDGTRYGSVNVTVSVDGEDIYSTFILYDQDEHWIISAKTSCTVTAGSHLIEVDAWNGSELEEGTVDAWSETRVLPFTTQHEMISVGVGWA